MKRIVSFMFVAAIASTSVLAQEPPPPSAQEQAPQREKVQRTPEQRAENMTKRLTKELALNADQQAKAKAAILKREQVREEMMKAEKEAQEKVEADFKTFFTDEQFKKFKDKEDEMKTKREERRAKPAPPKPPAPDGSTPPPAPKQK